MISFVPGLKKSKHIPKALTQDINPKLIQNINRTKGHADKTNFKYNSAKHSKFSDGCIRCMDDPHCLNIKVPGN